MILFLIEFALPAFFTIVCGWMTLEIIGACRDCGRFKDID